MVFETFPLFSYYQPPPSHAETAVACREDQLLPWHRVSDSGPSKVPADALKPPPPPLTLHSFSSPPVRPELLVVWTQHHHHLSAGPSRLSGGQIQL